MCLVAVVTISVLTVSVVTISAVTVSGVTVSAVITVSVVTVSVDTVSVVTVSKAGCRVAHSLHAIFSLPYGQVLSHVLRHQMFAALFQNYSLK